MIPAESEQFYACPECRTVIVLLPGMLCDSCLENLGTWQREFRPRIDEEKEAEDGPSKLIH